MILNEVVRKALIHNLIAHLLFKEKSNKAWPELKDIH